MLDVAEEYLGFYLSGAQGWICSDGPGYSNFFGQSSPSGDEEVMPAKAGSGGH